MRFKNYIYSLFNERSAKILLLTLAVFILPCCLKRKVRVIDNPYNLPIEDLSEIFNMDISDYIKTTEAKKYIFLKNFDVYILDYKNMNTNVTFSTLASKSKNIFYMLNYPERFSFSGFNALIKSEMYNVQNDVQARLYAMFIAKIFIPDSYNMDEIEDEVKEGVFTDKPALIEEMRKYRDKVEFSKVNGIFFIVDFYTINKDLILYKWKLKFTPKGEVTNCLVTMMSLDESYNVTGKAVIFDRKIKRGKNEGDEEDDLSFGIP